MGKAIGYRPSSGKVDFSILKGIGLQSARQ